MSGRTLEESIKIRKWIEAALSDGKQSPTQILEWIEQRKSKEMDSPSLSTISRIMQEKGYKPTGNKWEKAGE